MSTKRKAISTKDRFEVFKRDKFTCQYCGRSAPDVILNVDHIKPVSKDGESTLLNYITSCFDCNSGKGNRELSDDSVLSKQKKMLDQLQERREQIEMMLEWQRGLSDMDSESTDRASEFWSELVPPYSLTESGLQSLRKTIKRYGLSETLEAMRKSAMHYIVNDDEGKPTSESVAKAFDYIGRICNVSSQEKSKPYISELYKLRGLMRHRYNYTNDYESMAKLESAYLKGHDIDELKGMILDCRN